jgi:phosphate transport system permease protein
LGATKFDVSTKIVVPAALSGVLASFLLALSRSIGETMAVSIAAGQQPVLTINPLSQIQTMTSFIVNVMQGDVVAGSTLEKSLYAVALVLFAITLGMNLISQMILERYREVYQ